MKNSISHKENQIEHVYIHVPFCLRKCGYCSFYSVESADTQTRLAFIQALKKEINSHKNHFLLNPKTIYFGGGTPSLLSPEEITDILEQFPTENCYEITLEVNPATVDSNYIYSLRKTGVNRISIGAQSFLNEELKLLGRLHDSNSIVDTYNEFKIAGFSNISLDLIYGLPNQKGSDVKLSLKKLTDLKPQHVSIYCLSLEKNTPMYRSISDIPSDDIVSDFYYTVIDTLENTGLMQYEISNFALMGYESQHNLCYWNQSHYLGLGPSAAGFIPSSETWGVRYVNAANLQSYLNNPENAVVEKEQISLREAEKEFVCIGLRKTAGIELNEYSQKFSQDFVLRYKKILDSLQKQGFVEITDKSIRLSRKALFVSNAVLGKFHNFD
ncbi:MAG: radical SAM family heme chaperone HemW [Candidatus Cloacimonetes bacterium]|nr:radical SAM family heme chaperone HemW [Candidatus Cloacimonadota bacterium]